MAAPWLAARCTYLVLPFASSSGRGHFKQAEDVLKSLTKWGVTADIFQGVNMSVYTLTHTLTDLSTLT